MRSLHVILIPGLAAALGHASPDSACGPLPTVTVTVGATTITESFLDEKTLSHVIPTTSTWPVVSANAATSSAVATITLSSTTFLTSTKVINVAGHAVSNPIQPGPVQGGPYSFAEENGHTIWLGGKTPTSGGVYVTSTLAVTLQPQPSSTETLTFTKSSERILSSGDGTTSWTTTSTDFYTHYLTKALTLEATGSSLPAPKVPPYLGHFGWNATLTTLQTVRSGVANTKPSDVGSKNPATWSSSGDHSKSYHAYSETSAGWVPSGQVAPSASSPTRRRHPRQVGAVVTATIDGAVVTFTNVWAGESLTHAPSTSSKIPTSISVFPSLGVFLHKVSGGATAEVSQCHPKKSSNNHTCLNMWYSDPAQFDDLPQFSADAETTDIPPIFNPYHKLFFNGGFGYVPPPDDPFAPISPPQLAVYNYHNDSSSSQSIDAGLEIHGELGAGPRVHESAYWIDAYSVWIGCANGGPTDCQIDLIGYDAFNAAIARMTLLQPPCPGLVNCKLAQITFPGDFRDLAGLQVLAYVNKSPVTFYMDDLSLEWSNNTCAAQLERSSAQ
ncbi:MAG: hypothetical protein Q9200_004713 [Gallowayella weberi]